MTVTILDKATEPILIDGLTWQEFKMIEQVLDRPGIRLSFVDGTLKIRCLLEGSLIPSELLCQ